MSYSIVMIDVDTRTSIIEIEKAAAALQRQVLEHFFPHWGIPATVRAATPDDPPREDEWQLELRAVPTMENALGEHHVTETGQPRLVVFPLLDARDGVSWTITASHEVLEALADPWLRRGAQDDAGTWWAVEVCDAVENDTYDIDGVRVSNFCLPAWGEPPPRREGARYDYLGKCTKPWEIRDGGYGQKYNEAQGWTQVGAMRTARRTLHERGMSRTARRRA